MSDVAISSEKIKSCISYEVELERDATILDLPKEVLIEIFSQLQVHNILSCRCVCKTWYHLLSASNILFSSLHFARSAPLIFVETCDKRSCTYTHFIEVEDETKLYNNGFKFMRSGFELIKDNLRVVNSCNGFVCFATHYFDPVLVCNSLTGEYIDIPRLKYKPNRKPYIVSGFGCTLRSNQYKVVRLMSNIGKKYIKEGTKSSSIVKVFTIGTKSWRKIKSVPYYLDQSSCITCFHGAIHWVCKDIESDDYIISFDLESEKFVVIPPPSKFMHEIKWGISIGVIGECLYLTHMGELWVMKVYGDENSWTNVYEEQVWRYRFHEVLGYLKDGRILINSKSKVYCRIVAFDLVTKTCLEIPVPSVCDWTSRRLITHKPRLVSFKDAITIPDDGIDLEVHESLPQI